MNAQDVLETWFDYSGINTDASVDSDAILATFRRNLGWDGTGEPPIVAIMGDGTLKRADYCADGDDCGVWPGPLYRLVDPEAEQDARALEALGPELLAHIDNMEAE